MVHCIHARDLGKPARLLVEGARNLRDYLQNQGYFEADVQFKQQRVVNDQANLVTKTTYEIPGTG